MTNVAGTNTGLIAGTDLDDTVDIDDLYASDGSLIILNLLEIRLELVLMVLQVMIILPLQIVVQQLLLEQVPTQSLWVVGLILSLEMVTELQMEQIQ